MRTKDSDEQVQHLVQASDANTLDEIFTGLDVLGGLAWKINRPVFDVVSAVWNSGDSLADIPAKDSLTRPIDAEKPENLETDPRAKDTYRHRIRKALQERRASHSNRCDVNYKLEIGRAVRGFSSPLLVVEHGLMRAFRSASSSTRSSTFLTTWTSAVARTRSLPTSPTSVTTCVGGSFGSRKRSRSANGDYVGSRSTWPT